MSERRWHVVESLPKSEAWALENLQRQGFHCFFPRLRKMRRGARRTEVVAVPLFKGYLFVQFDKDRDPWRSVLGTFGVRRLVGPSGARPQAVPQKLMQQLIARCDPVTAMLRQDQFAPGDAVRFSAGPLADRIAKVEAMEDDGRVRLLLEILGGERQLRSNPSELLPA